MFYYYDEATVRELIAETQLELVYIEHANVKRKTAKWLYLGFRKCAA